MTIEGLGSIDPISKYNKTGKTNKPVKNEKSDSINISEESKTLGEIYKATEDVKLASDIRMDRINEVKEKLKDPNYINDKVISDVADKILDMFNL
jgi:negative regulator of flagellin synthesis FlgM